MKRVLSLLCALCLTASLLAGCGAGNTENNGGNAGNEGENTPPVSDQGDAGEEQTAQPVDVRVTALKGPTAMGMVEMMRQADGGELTDNNYQFTIEAATDAVTAALAPCQTVECPQAPAGQAALVTEPLSGADMAEKLAALGGKALSCIRIL